MAEKLKGQFTLLVHKARGLPPMTAGANQLLEAQVGPVIEHSQPCVDGGSSPIWGERLSFTLDGLSTVLFLRVYTESSDAPRVLLGHTDLFLPDLATRSRSPIWFPLTHAENSKKSAGEVLISASFVPLHETWESRMNSPSMHMNTASGGRTIAQTGFNSSYNPNYFKPILEPVVPDLFVNAPHRTMMKTEFYRKAPPSKQRNSQVQTDLTVDSTGQVANYSDIAAAQSQSMRSAGTQTSARLAGSSREPRETPQNPRIGSILALLLRKVEEKNRRPQSEFKRFIASQPALMTPKELEKCLLHFNIILSEKEFDTLFDHFAVKSAGDNQGKFQAIRMVQSLYPGTSVPAQSTSAPAQPQAAPAQSAVIDPNVHYELRSAQLNYSPSPVIAPLPVYYEAQPLNEEKVNQFVEEKSKIDQFEQEKQKIRKQVKIMEKHAVKEQKLWQQYHGNGQSPAPVQGGESVRGFFASSGEKSVNSYGAATKVGKSQPTFMLPVSRRTKSFASEEVMKRDQERDRCRADSTLSAFRGVQTGKPKQF